MSCGPGEASGWNWTENTGGAVSQTLDRAVVEVDLRDLQPSSVGTVSSSTWNPWFCEVIVTWPRREVADRVIAAAVPELQLAVSAPIARARSWCPRQIPK